MSPTPFIYPPVCTGKAHPITAAPSAADVTAQLFCLSFKGAETTTAATTLSVDFGSEAGGHYKGRAPCANRDTRISRGRRSHSLKLAPFIS